MKKNNLNEPCKYCGYKECSGCQELKWYVFPLMILFFALAWAAIIGGIYLASNLLWSLKEQKGSGGILI